jgi:uncharacterized protein (DUF849 family)
MAKPVWLEVALNGPWGRRLQPRIPVGADEIVADAMACHEAGASILHFHAYDEATGRQRDDYEIYAPIIERIRARADVICYPTIPFAGSADAPGAMSPAQRFAAVEKLLAAGLIEWAVVDPGSTNLAHKAALAAGREGFVYANPEAHIRHGLALSQAHRMTPSYAIYEPGFLRLGAALHRQYPGAPVPIYRLMFSDGMAFGFPPAKWAVAAYLKLLRAEARGAPWMIAGLEVDIEPLIATAVRHGGHVRVGLEDAPLGIEASNVDLARRAARLIEAEGGRVAGTADVRAMLTSAATD